MHLEAVIFRILCSKIYKDQFLAVPSYRGKTSGHFLRRGKICIVKTIIIYDSDVCSVFTTVMVLR